MVGNMLERQRNDNQEIVAFDLNKENVNKAAEDSGIGCDSFEKIALHCEDSGTARWVSEYSTNTAIPVPAITISLFEWFASEHDNPVTAKIIVASRNLFGGHAIK